MEDYSENRELIALAQSDNGAVSERATERLICANTGLVRSIALKFASRGVEFEDLMQIGSIGMLKAIRSFDLQRGTAFSTYAVPLIIGEIRRHLRDEGMIKVGRATKKLGAELLRERSRIISERGVEPSVGELAELCGVTREEAADALDATSPITSLSESISDDGDGRELQSVLPDSDGLAEIEQSRDRIALAQAISHMPPLWRQIVMLRFYKNLTQSRTAELLGLTQVKISREEKKIFDFLRGELCG